MKEFKTRYDTAKDILTPFHVAVSPVDNHDTTVIIEEDLKILSRLGLPTYTYKEIVDKIVDEIRQRQRYVL